MIFESVKDIEKHQRDIIRAVKKSKAGRKAQKKAERKLRKALRARDVAQMRAYIGAAQVALDKALTIATYGVR